MSRLDRFAATRNEETSSSQISELQAQIERLQKEQPTTWLDPRLIQRSPYQPRKFFDPVAQAQLTASIREFGVLQNLVVRMVGDVYQLVAGERRLISAIEAEVDVPILLMELSDLDARRLALAENIQRENLNPIEETSAILNLLLIELGVESVQEVKSILNELSYVARGRKVADNVVGNADNLSIVSNVLAVSLNGMTLEAFLRHRLPLLDLPCDIIEAIEQGLEYTKAVAISRIEDPAQRADLLRCAIEEGMPLSEIKKQIKDLIPTNEKKEPTPKDRVRATLAQVTKSRVWEDSQKWQQVENLLAQLDVLLSSSAD